MDRDVELFPIVQPGAFEFAIVDTEAERLYAKHIEYSMAKGIGYIPLEDMLDLGVTGPMLRAAGLKIDVRKDAPYSSYEKFDFEVPTRTENDVFSRYLVRIEEMRQSTKIIRQALDGMPAGSHQADAPGIVLPDRVGVSALRDAGPTSKLTLGQAKLIPLELKLDCHRTGDHATAEIAQPGYRLVDVGKHRNLTDRAQQCSRVQLAIVVGFALRIDLFPRHDQAACQGIAFEGFRWQNTIATALKFAAVDAIRFFDATTLEPLFVIRLRIAFLDQIAVRQEIQELFNLGYFYTVEVDRSDGPKVTLTYSVTEKPSIAEIEYKGHDELEETELKEAAASNQREIYRL